MELDDLREQWKRADKIHPRKNLNIMELIQHRSYGPVAALKRSLRKQMIAMTVVPIAIIATNLSHIDKTLTSAMFWFYIVFCVGVIIFARLNYAVVKKMEGMDAMVKSNLEQQIFILETRLRQNIIGIRVALLLFIVLTEVLPYFQNFRMLNTWHSLSPLIRFGAYTVLFLFQYLLSREVSRRKFEHRDFRNRIKKGLWQNIKTLLKKKQLWQFMNRNRFLILSAIFFLVVVGIILFAKKETADGRFISYIIDVRKQDIKLYWKDDKNQAFRSIQNLKNWLNAKDQKLLFATNGGMYKVDNSPLGLYIQDRKLITPLNKRTASGNFYWKPNGILYLDIDNNAGVCKTEDFVTNGRIKYATQSGPMLVFDGNIHPEFKKGSSNLNIRNGVGLLPNNELVLVMSKHEVNLYDFAKYFKELGCKNALSFDGFVCRTYLPEKNWVQTDGNFGVIIAVATRK